MMSSLTGHRFIILFWLCLSLSLVSCDKGPEKTAEETKSIIVLDDATVKQFTQSLSKDYIKTQQELLVAFNSYKKAGDIYGFTKFRNNKWTPAYIEKKDYYQAVLDKNRAYISTAGIKPLFLRFENLIYIGINLKNGLLNEDQELLKTTLAEAAADKKIVESFAK